MSEVMKRPSPLAFLLPVGLIAWSIFRLYTRPHSTFWKVMFIGVICLASIDLIIKLTAMFMGRGKPAIEENAEAGKREKLVEDLEDRSTHS